MAVWDRTLLVVMHQAGRTLSCSDMSCLSHDTEQAYSSYSCGEIMFETCVIFPWDINFENLLLWLWKFEIKSYLIIFTYVHLNLTGSLLYQ